MGTGKAIAQHDLRHAGAHESEVRGLGCGQDVLLRQLLGLKDELEPDVPATDDVRPLRARLEETLAAVKSEKLGEVALEFDHIHSVERAREVGSIHRILPPHELRPYLIDAVERGMEKELARLGAQRVQLVETAT